MNSSHTTRTAVPSRRISTRDLAFAGMIAAILAIISQISVPMPTGVPITIQVFGITLIGVAFGWRLGLYGSLVLSAFQSLQTSAEAFLYWWI